MNTPIRVIGSGEVRPGKTNIGSAFSYECCKMTIKSVVSDELFALLESTRNCGRVRPKAQPDFKKDTTD